MTFPRKSLELLVVSVLLVSLAACGGLAGEPRIVSTEPLPTVTPTAPPDLGRPSARVSLARGAGEAGASVPAGSAVRLNADVAELPPLPKWQIDVVNATGALEHTTQAAAAGARLSWDLKAKLPVGQHWVRLRDPRDGSLVREFGLQVR